MYQNSANARPEEHWSISDSSNLSQTPSRSCDRNRRQEKQVNNELCGPLSPALVPNCILRPCVYCASDSFPILFLYVDFVYLLSLVFVPARRSLCYLCPVLYVNDVKFLKSYREAASTWYCKNEGFIGAPQRKCGNDFEFSTINTFAFGCLLISYRHGNRVIAIISAWLCSKFGLFYNKSLLNRNLFHYCWM